MNTTVANYGMDTLPAFKAEAKNLCVDAVNCLADTCNNGIDGTSGAGAHPHLTHEAAKGGAVVWNNKDGAQQIGFAFILLSTNP